MNGDQAQTSVEHFVVARNPEEDSRLSYLLRLPFKGNPLLLTDSRKFAEECTYRYLATALADAGVDT
jgi:hypothetical protein